MRRYLQQEIETMPIEALRTLQWNGLNEFMRRYVWSNPFYAERYAVAGIGRDQITSLESFSMLPIVRKEDILADISSCPPFGQRNVAAPNEIRQVVETSGTSGLGRERYPLNQADLDGVLSMEVFGFYWAGIESGAIAASSLPLTTRAGGQWYYGAVRRLGGVYLALGTYDTQQKLRYLAEFDVDLLIGGPSYLHRYEVAARETGINLADLRVKGLMVAGEPFSAAWVAEREEVWGSKLYEQYGSTQRAIAWTCEEGARQGDQLGVLHTLPHLALYEVIDPATGREVPNGESGELIITPFAASTVAPLVRFATGDRVTKVAEPCSCGRTLPGFRAGSIERLDSMIKVRGVNLFPPALDDVIMQSPVAEYQGRVFIDPATGREEIEVAVQFLEGERVSDAFLRNLEARLREAVGLRFTAVAHRGPSLLPEIRDDVKKRRRWLDQRRSVSTQI